jgi:hypothetical protein
MSRHKEITARRDEPTSKSFDTTSRSFASVVSKRRDDAAGRKETVSPTGGDAAHSRDDAPERRGDVATVGDQVSKPREHVSIERDGFRFVTTRRVRVKGRRLVATWRRRTILCLRPIAL